MSKKLYILRHAQAAGGLNLSDFERPLSEYGIKQARTIGEYLENIDLALCSAAIRTRETLTEAMKFHSPAKKIKYVDNLYCAPTETLLNAVRGEDTDNILIVAHNPGIFQFAFIMAQDEDSPEYAKLISGYPPCSLTILNCEINDWSQLTAGQNKLVKFIRGDSLLSE